MKRIMIFLSIIFIHSCKLDRQFAHYYRIVNLSNQDIVLKRNNPVTGVKEFIVKKNQTIEFDGAIGCGYNCLPTIDSIAIILENNLVIINSCKNSKSANCQTEHSFFNCDSYKLEIIEKTKIITRNYLYEFTDADLKRAKKL